MGGAIAALALGASPTLAESLFHPGPSLDPVGFDGYFMPELAMRPGYTAGSGYGVAAIQRAVNGSGIGKHGLIWDANGYSELGGLGFDANGHYNSFAYATNGTGTIVGNASMYNSSQQERGNRPVRWDPGSTTAVELESLGTDASGWSFNQAVAVNSSGMIAGHGSKYTDGMDRGWRVMRWAPGSTAVTELGTLGTNNSGSTYNYAMRMNDAGTIVGRGAKWVDGSMCGFRAIRWDADNTAAIELGNLGLSSYGSTDAKTTDINNSGTIVGEASLYDSGDYLGVRAVRWDAGGTTATDLGCLGTDGSGMGTSTAMTINDAGIIAGTSAKYDPTGASRGTRAVRWDAGSTDPIELAVLDENSDGQGSATVNDINSDGYIVGSSMTYTEDYPALRNHAVMWTPDDVLVDLNSLLDPDSPWVLSWAAAISDDGWITGIGYYDADGTLPMDAGTSYERLFLMQVPEPSTVAMLALGGLLLARRRGGRAVA
jgi:hypothetical protein